MIGLGSPEAAASTAADERAMERRVLSLHARRGQDLFGFAVRMGLSEEDAADAVQEAMLRLWRELSGGKELLDLDAWAFRVVYRLAIDRHRLGARLAASLGRLFARADAAPDPAETSESAAVWAAVDGLPERQRAAIYLRYRADMTFEGLRCASLPTVAPLSSPSAGATYFQYTVQPGDTMTKIAGKYQIQPSDLIAANPQLADPSHLEPGWIINVPPRT